MNEINEIFNELMDNTDVWDDDTELAIDNAYKTAKSQLKDMILKEVIGEDETATPVNSHADHYFNEDKDTRNKLRQILRTKLNELFEGKQ